MRRPETKVDPLQRSSDRILRGKRRCCSTKTNVPVTGDLLWTGPGSGSGQILHCPGLLVAV